MIRSHYYHIIVLLHEHSPKSYVLKNHKRALRRFHKHRIHKKRRKYWMLDHFIGEQRSEENLKKLSKTPIMCSCWMCGNPRKYYNEKTVQELKAEEKFQSDINDMAA